MSETHRGSCLCGGVTIETTGPPSSVAACHCPSCRKHSGAPVSVFVDYPVIRVRISGISIKYYASSPGVSRGFCRQCGASVSFQADNLPDMLHLHIGMFDTPAEFAPSANENTDNRLPWIHIDTVE